MKSQPRSDFACPYLRQEITMPSRVAFMWRVLFALLLLPRVVREQKQVVRQVPLASRGPLPMTPPTNGNAERGPEFDAVMVSGDADGGDDNGAGPGIAVNRTISKGPGVPRGHGGNGKAKSNPELALTIDGINHFQQRFVAAGGNKFSFEPPRQGLCVGNRVVLGRGDGTRRVFVTA